MFMSFGKNLQYLRRLSCEMTQESLAEKLNVSRQTISKWELDMVQPDIDKAIELCKLFSCSLDNLFREELNACDDAYTNLRTETVPAFRYVKHTVISTDPEGDALNHIFNTAKDNGVENPQVIGWDFPYLSQEQINVYNMHGYTAAWILPNNITPNGMQICEQKAHKYAAIHIEKPFENPFVIIPNAYRTLAEYIRLNGLDYECTDVLPSFETDGDSMDVYIACR